MYYYITLVMVNSMSENVSKDRNTEQAKDQCLCEREVD